MALDFEDRSGSHVVASARGRFDHRATSANPPVPGASLDEFPSWALAYRDVSGSLRPGPTVGTLLDAGGHAHGAP